MTFTSAEQRIANAYLDLFPDFVPAEDAEISVKEQEEFYRLIERLYRLGFEEPELFVPSLHEDDCFPNRFNRTSYAKPKLQSNMRKFSKAVEGLLEAMFLLGQGGEVKLNKRQAAVLERLDAQTPSAAWVWMSTRPGANLSRFSHCLFRADYPYSSAVYARLLGEGPFRRLEGWMAGHGYRWYDIADVPASDCKFSLTYANPAWGADTPRGGFEYKIRHTGISTRYDAMIAEPATIGLCIPNGMKAYLEAFGRMEPRVQDFVVERTKKCDGCRYCVQTDKTGARPLAAIPVSYRQEEIRLCPHFPGYSYCWSTLTDELVDQMIALLAFMDSFVQDKNP